MVKKVLLDTDILIDELRQPKKANIWKKLQTQTIKCSISPITMTELWVGESISTTKGRREVQKLLAKITIIRIGDQIFKQAGVLLRNNKNLHIADALIASSSLYYKLPLVTLNKRHFEHIKRLKLYQIES